MSTTFATPADARTKALRWRRMADEVARMPEFDGREEKVRELRARSKEAYDHARRLEGGERPGPTRDRSAAPPKPAGFSARSALKRAGLGATRRADRAARNAPHAARRVASSSGAIPNLGFNSQGFAGIAVWAFASIIGLALLDAALGGNGPLGISKSLGWLGAAIDKLVSSTDPIIPQGKSSPPATTPAPVPATASGAAGGTTGGQSGQSSGVLGWIASSVNAATNPTTGKPLP